MSDGAVSEGDEYAVMVTPEMKAAGAAVLLRADAVAPSLEELAARVYEAMALALPPIVGISPPELPAGLRWEVKKP